MKIIQNEYNSEYYDRVTLKDAKFGFSIKRKYPEKFPYKPPITKLGNPDIVAVLWVILHSDELSDDGKILLTVRISSYSLWSAKYYFTPDENNPESPTKESIKVSELTPKPESLDYRNDFFFDSNKNLFFDKKNQAISGRGILDFVFKEHCDTLHPIRGFELKFKRGVYKFCSFLLSINIFLLKFFLERVFQTKITNQNSISEYFEGYQDIQTAQTISLEIFGYKASKTTIIIFCALVTIASIGHYYGFVKLHYFQSVSKDSFLVIAHSILILALLELFPKTVLFPVINVLIKTRAKISYISIDPFSYKKWLLPTFCVFVLFCTICFINY
jgi:hypothetical protein